MALSKNAENYLTSLSKKGIHWFEDKNVKFVCLFEKSSQIKAIKPVLGPAKDNINL